LPSVHSRNARSVAVIVADIDSMLSTVLLSSIKVLMQASFRSLLVNSKAMITHAKAVCHDSDEHFCRFRHYIRLTLVSCWHLMENWQSGDIPAFEAFFREYERQVYRNAFLILGNREDAEDVLQNVFTSVWKFRRTFNPEKGKIATWLHRITVNECMRNLSRGHREVARVDPEELNIAAPEQDARMDSADMLEQLAALDGRQRAALVLRYYNDLSYQEIAEALGVPLGTVKSRINHALRALRARFEDK
jgi:RNA polymerase sigma-70 factor, ECF subfamily